MLEITKIWIFIYFWPSKMTSTCSKQPMDHGGISECQSNEIYPRIKKGGEGVICYLFY